MFRAMSNQATARLRTLPELVIFDCDGVLVDSEGPANRILAKALRREGLDVDEAEVAKATTGITLAAVVAWAEGLLGKPLPSDFLDRLRVETYAAFKSELTAVSGVARAVDAVQASGVKTCVASSGSIEKMNLTLGLTGLLDKFQSRLFSAKQVEHGKPHPDVFLLAAREMGVAPPAAIVVEDSLPGVQAGVAAGMTVFAYAAPELAGVGHGPEELAAAGGQVFRRMEELPEVIGIRSHKEPA